MTNRDAGLGTARDPAGLVGWTFLTNHAHVLLAVARDPQITLRAAAAGVGITERATQKIVADLEAAVHEQRPGLAGPRVAVGGAGGQSSVTGQQLDRLSDPAHESLPVVAVHDLRPEAREGASGAPRHEHVAHHLVRYSGDRCQEARSAVVGGAGSTGPLSYVRAVDRWRDNALAGVGL